MHRIRVAFLVTIPVVAIALAAQSNGASIVLPHFLHGRAGTCSLRQSFESFRISRHQRQDWDDLEKASHIVRSESNFVLWSTPMGEYWIPAASKDAVLYDLSEQHRSIYGNGSVVVREGDIVLDAGANVGVFTRTALAAGAKTVVAIEPAPENLECLRRNFKNEIVEGRVIIYPKGVWNRDDTLQMKIDPTDSARDTFVRPIEGARFVQVPLTTIDELIEELKLPRVDFIKMDIEGAEQQALAGARKTIREYHPRMALCVYHLVGDDVAIPRVVDEIEPGYRRNMTCLCAPDRIQPEVAFFYKD